MLNYQRVPSPLQHDHGMFSKESHLLSSKKNRPILEGNGALNVWLRVKMAGLSIDISTMITIR